MCGDTPENGPLFGRVYTGPKPGVTDERRRSAGFDCKFSFSPFPPFLACRTVTEVAFCRPPPPCRPSVSNPPAREVAVPDFGPAGGPEPGVLSNRSSLVAKCRAIGAKLPYHALPVEVPFLARFRGYPAKTTSGSWRLPHIPRIETARDAGVAGALYDGTPIGKNGEFVGGGEEAQGVLVGAHLAERFQADL